MGQLIDNESGEVQWLPGVCVVGRSTACQLQLMDRRVSAHHAELRWNGQLWLLRDLGSRNGTWLDGKRLPASSITPLDQQQTLSLGKGGRSFSLVSADAPRLMARACDGTWRVAEGHALSLPSEEHAQMMVYPGERGGWIVEQHGELSQAVDQQDLTVADTRFRLFLPRVADATSAVDQSHELSLVQSRLSFRVSRDEEHVTIRVEHGSTSLELENRAHLYLLLLLARARLEDSRSDLASEEWGWVDREDLVKQLGVDVEQLNVWVFRARQQLAKALPRGATDIIQRRSGPPQLRLGIENIEIRQA